MYKGLYVSQVTSSMFLMILNIAIKLVPCQHICDERTIGRLCKIYVFNILLGFSLTVKAAPHECVIRTGQP